VILLHNIIHVCYGGTDEEGEDEGKLEVVSGPKVNVDSIQDAEQWKPPRDTVDDDTLSVGEELIDDGTE